MLNEDEYRRTVSGLNDEDLHYLYSLNLKNAIRAFNKGCPIAQRKTELIMQECKMRELVCGG